MKYKTLAILICLNQLNADPIMLEPGKVIKEFSFNDQSEINNDTLGTRKETQLKIEDQKLYAVPPTVAYAGLNKSSKWSKSNMARIHFPNVQKEYIVEFDWLHKKVDDQKCKLYIDLGHRCIRATMSRTGTILLLENHLVGKDAEETSKILDTNNNLTLIDDKWYHVIVEVKGDEVLVQVDDQKLYGKDPLISKNKPSSFNLDSSGAGFLVENFKMYEVKSFQSDWKSKIE